MQEIFVIRDTSDIIILTYRESAALSYHNLFMERPHDFRSNSVWAVPGTFGFESSAKSKPTFDKSGEN